MPQDIPSTVRAIDVELPQLARSVIRRHLDARDPANQAFLRDPDDLNQHQTDWHRWGIITHTRVFLRHFDVDIPRYLCEWGLWSTVEDMRRRHIDGASRWQLLRIAILLHDIGKFAARTQRGARFHFAHHEALSGEIIRRELDLAMFGLTPEQIEYIAVTAEDHFVLALVRKRAREDGQYTVAFTWTERFVALAAAIKEQHPDDFVEIGVLFLGDSLAKVDPAHGPERALSQHETNIAVARRYLELVLRDPSI